MMDEGYLPNTDDPNPAQSGVTIQSKAGLSFPGTVFDGPDILCDCDIVYDCKRFTWLQIRSHRTSKPISKIRCTGRFICNWTLARTN